MIDKPKKDKTPEGSDRKDAQGGDDKAPAKSSAQVGPVGDKPGAEKPAAPHSEQKKAEPDGQPPKAEGPKDKPVAAARPGDTRIPPTPASRPAEAKPTEPKPGDVKVGATTNAGDAKPGVGKPAPAAGTTPPPSRPQPAKAKKSGGGSGWLWLIGILIVIAAGVYFTRPYWQPAATQYARELLPETEESNQLAALEQRLAELEQRMATQQQEIAAAAKGEEIDSKLGMAAERLDRLEGSVSALEKVTAASVVGGTEQADAFMAELNERIDEVAQQVVALAGVTARVAQLESVDRTVIEGSTSAAATVLAIGQLSSALDGSGPYAGPLATVQGLAGDDPKIAEAIAALEPNAGAGVATLVDLRSRFPATAREMVQADARMRGDDWVDKAVNRLTSLVTVRKTGKAAAEAGGVDAALVVAEESLAAGDLAGAVAALEGVEGPAAEAAAGWLKDAKARLEADQALARLKEQAIALLASARG